jgi:hypothetical protein
VIDANVFARYMTAIADRIRFPLSDSTNALYYVTLSERLTTEQFEAAATRVFADYTDFGFPPVSVFCAELPPVVDGQKILRQISKLSDYSPSVGMIPPNVGQVRDAFGDVIADAFASAGSNRLFSDDDTTRHIAEREFQKAAERYAAMPDVPRPLLESGAGPRIHGRRNAKPESIANIVARALPPGTAT